MSADKKPPDLAPIRADEIYPLRELMRRLGWKEAALRRARRDGLRIRRYGNLFYVLGSDAVDFLSEQR